MKKLFVIPLIILFLGFGVSYSWQFNSGKTGKKGKSFTIIDMHMHVFQWNKYGIPPPPNLITGKAPTATSDEQALQNYIQEMKRHNILLAVGSGELEMVAKMKALIPNNFFGGTEFPRYTKPVYQRVENWPDLDELRKLYNTDQLQIMGEISAQYAGVPLNDPSLEDYYALADELDIPVCLHSGFGPAMSPYRGDPKFRMRYGNPLLLEDVLVNYPNLRVYIAHGGYPFLTETIALMLMYQQVYIDISAINWILTKDEFYNYLQRLMQARLGKRIMYGSDQMIWPETVGLSIDAIKSAPFLTESEKQDILFNNAVKFLRLDASKLNN